MWFGLKLLSRIFANRCKTSNEEIAQHEEQTDHCDWAERSREVDVYRAHLERAATPSRYHHLHDENASRRRREGDPYHFVARPKFEELIQQGFFVEWAQTHGNLYGTPWNQFHEAWDNGFGVIMDVDVQGARHFKKEFPDALTIFLSPPDIDALRNRILKRGIAKDVEVRIETATREMQAAREFDHLLINDDFETAFREFRNLIENLLKNQ